GLPQAEQKDGNRAGLRRAAHAGKSKRGLVGPALGCGRFIDERLVVDGAVAQADITLAQDRAAVTDEAVVGQRLAEQAVRLADAHRVTVVRVRGLVQPVAFPEPAGIFRRLLLQVFAPGFPGVLVALQAQAGRREVTT